MGRSGIVCSYMKVMLGSFSEVNCTKISFYFHSQLFVVLVHCCCVLQHMCDLYLNVWRLELWILLGTNVSVVQ
jgi:hypothetical protein